MKILGIIEDENLKNIIENHLEAEDRKILFSNNPIKAMDLIETFEPDFVIFGFEDFPRHWKIFFQILRDTYPEEKSKFILITGKTFTDEEASQASLLKIKMMIPWNEKKEDPDLAGYLKKTISNHPKEEPKSEEDPAIPERIDDKIGFLFTNPETFELVNGDVAGISEREILIALPKEKLLRIAPDSDINFCSLKLGNRYMTVNCRIVSDEGPAHFIFKDIKDDERAEIKKYLSEENIKR